MKITFSNLGAIKKTTLHLRPLTVIIGPNNSSKTYIAYSVYGLWQTMRENGTDFFDGLEIIKESKGKLKRVIDDKFYSKFKTHIKNLENEDYVALAIDNAGMKIGVKESKETFANKIKGDLTKLGLKSDQHFTIEKIQ